ncbi:hypothetical protein BD410DRAFT_785684 [Rickenella mellea]|uniref:Zn(2)-C6 fungal-type domain-containing protein n=1 Tax=Rickenella mellea TaxID=50990 RepID=A0A4Y7QDJ5_9AGAM|nr:hypothetical protein BD410DRAFT_785684 [Rickenella mellea]
MALSFTPSSLTLSMPQSSLSSPSLTQRNVHSIPIRPIETQSSLTLSESIRNIARNMAAQHHYGHRQSAVADSYAQIPPQNEGVHRQVTSPQPRRLPDDNLGNGPSCRTDSAGGRASDSETARSHRSDDSPISSAFVATPPLIATFPQENLYDTTVPSMTLPTSSAESSFFYRSPNNSVRQRTSQACEKCRERKTKCSGTRPVCKRCSDRGLCCVYASDSKSRGLQRSKQRSAEVIKVEDPTTFNISRPRSVPSNVESPRHPPARASSTSLEVPGMLYPSTKPQPLMLRWPAEPAAPKNEIVYTAVTPPAITVSAPDYMHADMIGQTRSAFDFDPNGGGQYYLQDGYLSGYQRSFDYAGGISTPPSATASHFSLSSDSDLGELGYPSSATEPHFNLPYDNSVGYAHTPVMATDEFNGFSGSLHGPSSPVPGSYSYDVNAAAAFNRNHGFEHPIDDELVSQFVNSEFTFSHP